LEPFWQFSKVFLVTLLFSIRHKSELKPTDFENALRALKITLFRFPAQNLRCSIEQKKHQKNFFQKEAVSFVLVKMEILKPLCKKTAKWKWLTADWVKLI
jgi:hypothetical protein